MEALSPSRRAPGHRRASALALIVGLLASSASARVVPAVVIASEGDPLAGSTLANLNAPFTNGDGKVGFTFSLAVGGTGVWYDTGLRWLGSDGLPDNVTGGESTMGIGDQGEFVYSPSVNGDDAVWGELGPILVETWPAPGFPAGTVTTFHSRPQMIDDGTAYWIAGFNETGGTATQGRALYRNRGVGPPEVVLRSDDLIGGLPIARSDGVTFDYHVSGDGAHAIHVLLLDTGAANVEVVEVGGLAVAREGDPTGAGDAWENFDDVSINAAGDHLFSGDTDGASETNEILAFNASIALREGDSVDGVSLAAGATVQALSLNDLGQAVHLWRVASGAEHLFFAAAAADLASSTVILSTGDELDIDGDGSGDALVADLTASGVVGPGLDLAEDGFVFVGVDLEPIGGGTAREAIVRLGLGAPPSNQLYRSSVADLSTGWQTRVPLPLTPASTIDSGWPRPFDVPGRLDDTGVLLERSPLVLYRLLDGTGAPLGPGLRVERGPGPGDLQISY